MTSKAVATFWEAVVGYPRADNRRITGSETLGKRGPPRPRLCSMIYFLIKLLLSPIFTRPDLAPATTRDELSIDMIAGYEVNTEGLGVNWGGDDTISQTSYSSDGWRT